MKKETRGRKPSANPANARCEFRVTPEQKLKYEVAAKKLNMPLSSWLKYIADKNA